MADRRMDIDWFHRVSAPEVNRIEHLAEYE